MLLLLLLLFHGRCDNSIRNRSHGKLVSTVAVVVIVVVVVVDTVLLINIICIGCSIGIRIRTANVIISRTTMIIIII